MTTTKSAVMGLPIRVRLPCERCGTLHIDRGEFATERHHTHQCEKCGLVWRPAEEDTIGVQFLYDQTKPEQVKITGSWWLPVELSYAELYDRSFQELKATKLIPTEMSHTDRVLANLRKHFHGWATVDFKEATLHFKFISGVKDTVDKINKALSWYGRPEGLASIRVTWNEP